MRLSKAVTPLLGIAALSLGLLASPANASVGPGFETDTDIPEAEVHGVERGDGYVVVYPVSDTPPEGEEADLLPTGEIDDDTLVIVANADGTLPLGLEPEELVEAHAVVNERFPRGASDELVLNLLESEGFDIESASGEVGVQNSTCKSFIPGLSKWGPASTSSVAVFGRPGTQVNYRFWPTFAVGQSLIVGQGIGFDQNTAGQVRRWYNLGSAYTGATQSRNVPWGNNAATPQFRAQSVNIGASGQWCH